MYEQNNRAVNEVAARIREMREITGFTEAQMAEHTQISEEQYKAY